MKVISDREYTMAREAMLVILQILRKLPEEDNPAYQMDNIVTPALRGYQEFLAQLPPKEN